MKAVNYIRIQISLFLVFSIFSAHADSKTPSIKVGLVSILSGDLAILGKNALNAVKTYEKHYLRHKIEFKVEDARLSSTEGLRAYQRLVNLEHVDVVLAACTSNGTMAAKGLINSTQTPTFSISTGGPNIDAAGPYLFRIGNSDYLNGTQQADYFIENGIKRVALLSEETEYTQDIAIAFRKHFAKRGGKLSFDQSFLPGLSDFRSEIARITSKKPEAIFMPTQTGTALGLFIKQLHQSGREVAIPVHTTFVAAPNPDAHTVAGKRIFGTYYMDPEYDAKSSSYKRFLKLYRQDHGEDPPVAFHAAGIVDALDHLQNFLDIHGTFNKEAFRKYLLEITGQYCGLMGCYRFDENGNTDLGFRMAQIVEQ